MVPDETASACPGAESVPELPLKWERLRGWKDFEGRDDLGKGTVLRGVYIWGFQVASEFAPYYVGKARNLYERALQHMSSLYGGAYVLYPADRFLNWHTGPPEPNRVYRPTGPSAFAERMGAGTRERFEAAIEAFRITWAEVPKPVDTAAVERSLASRFGGPKCEYLGTRVAAREEFRLVADGDSDPVVKRLFAAARPPVRVSVLP